MGEIVPNSYLAMASPPHAALAWPSAGVWLNVAGDALLAIAFLAIPAALLWFARRRPDLRFRPLFPAFAAFLSICALVHAASAFGFLLPAYWLAGGLKLAAAATFLGGAIVLMPLVPRMLTLPTAHALQQINAELEHEITLRVNAELDLRAAYQELEARVAQRTRELSTANERLTEEIEERRRTEEALRRLHEDLEHHIAARTAELTQSVAELESFSYSISHDLRAPLRAINGYAEILRTEHAGGLAPQGCELLARIARNATKMAQLIDGLLDFSRLARSEASARPVDMDALARGVATELGSEGGDSRVEVAVVDLPPIHGDEAMLRQVWTNLLSNAFKFSRRTDQPKVAVRATRSADEIVFEVRDNGVGFDMAYADKLFGVFNRLHSASEFPGAGVGLAIVRRIVERHGGRVWAESMPGAGSTFYFALPSGPGPVAAQGGRRG